MQADQQEPTITPNLKKRRNNTSLHGFNKVIMAAVTLKINRIILRVRFKSHYYDYKHL